MADHCSIWLSDAKFTRSAGFSLASTLYSKNVTIGLQGDLGAGKTTFMQGFLDGLGISDTVTSPTYALEQRYKVESGKWKVESDGRKPSPDRDPRSTRAPLPGCGDYDIEILHIDLYRLNEKQADAFLDQSSDHQGLRCIEWIDRSTVKPDILVTLEDEREGRRLTIQFDDIHMPSEQEIEQWRKEVALPPHIAKHCDAVTAKAKTLGDELLGRGIIMRPQAIKIAALLHDLLRFVDFKAGSSHVDHAVTPEDEQLWKRLTKQYGGEGHEKACAKFLTERGFPELGVMIEQHGLKHGPHAHSTIEQKLLYYADKRVMLHTECTLEERFADLAVRYCDGNLSDDQKRWFEEVKLIEKDLGFSL